MLDKPLTKENAMHLNAAWTAAYQCRDVSTGYRYSLLVLVAPGQREPVPVHVVVVFRHVLGGFIRGYKHDFELSRRVALLHQLGVEITQHRGEVTARRAPAGGEIQTDYFITEWIFWVHRISVFIQQHAPRKHFRHHRRNDKHQHSPEMCQQLIEQLWQALETNLLQIAVTSI